MRVVAGDLRGRRLESPPPGADVRPTADRVREALFSILGDVRGARVLDLYCGTGALAIEALSRGAATAVLVDRDVQLAESNVAGVGLEDRCRTVRSDALDFLVRDDGGYDLIIADPPYSLADRLEGKLESLVAPRLGRGGRLIVESAARRPLVLDLPLLDRRDYGATAISIHRAPEPG